MYIYILVTSWCYWVYQVYHMPPVPGINHRLFAHVHDSRDIRFAHPGLEKDIFATMETLQKVYITEFPLW